MFLSMANDGCLTRRYQQLRDQGVRSRDRLSPELQQWVDLQPHEGLGDLNPQTYRYITPIPGAQFKLVQMVDRRQAEKIIGMWWDDAQ